MRGYMFRNRWLALLFVAIVLAGVTRIVGTGNGDGAIDAAKQQFAEQKAQAEALTSETQSLENPTTVEIIPDEDLIDPAVGEDPTPIDQRLGESEDEIPPGAVVLVSQEDDVPMPEPAQ